MNHQRPVNPEKEFHSEAYLYHNRARFDHFQSLGLPVEGKSVLELGAGIGDHTAFLLSLGAQEIMAVEARDENIAVLRERFQDMEEVSVLKMDLETPVPLHRTFDLVYCYGLLYHLANPGVALEWMAGATKEILVLETCVAPSAEGKGVVVVPEKQDKVSQSFSGRGSRPTREWIMEKLSGLFPYAYVTVTQPDHPEFPLDWNAVNRGNRHTRAVFIGANLCLDANQHLSRNLLHVHRKLERESLR
ncbi:MAG: [2,4-di-O-methyl-alpha-L-fucopyranosyl-(1-_3)-alp ha-L-rhamnopyranosyl-(1-_3)-2-O-methyl-alpha-L-rhamnopyrano syl] dimycocerosyl phenol-phthiocerol 3'''-O-methyltransferase [Desulfobulbaceae bacterium]